MLVDGVHPSAFETAQLRDLSFVVVCVTKCVVQEHMSPQENLKAFFNSFNCGRRTEENAKIPP